MDRLNVTIESGFVKPSKLDWNLDYFFAFLSRLCKPRFSRPR